MMRSAERTLNLAQSTNFGVNIASNEVIEAMQRFTLYQEHFVDTPGWFEEPAAAIWDILLTVQTERGIKGDLMEIGVWKGKSAALLALHCQQEESCILVDSCPMDDAAARISAIVPNAQCIYLNRTSALLSYDPEMLRRSGSIRWFHIDGEHTSEAVTDDLRTADVLLSKTGVVTVDDFFSPAYPQVTHAVFQFLFTHPARFSLILSGFNKAYLCRPMVAWKYLIFLKECLHKEMCLRGFENVTVWKTAGTSDMGAFGITDQYLDFDYRGPDWNEREIPL